MNSDRLRRVPRRLLAALAASACLATAGAATADPAPPVAWTDCGAPYQCATLTVPRDYGQPAGPTIDVALIRLPASRPAERIGSLVVNPGGPGGSGVQFVRDAGDSLFATLNRRFDIVGFDPRGAGATSPVTCTDSATQDGIIARSKGFPTLADRDQVVADARLLAQACLDNTGDALRYLSTENTARDMDRLREALGDPKLSYLGFSYGTYLGATYGALFPTRVRALVLDGALNPTTYANDPLRVDLDQARGFQTAMERFLDWCTTECQFGDGNPTAAYRALLRRADATPLAGPDGRPVRSYEILNATIITLYTRQTWPLLAAALQLADQGDAEVMQVLADAAVGRNDDGTYDNGLGAFNAISNIDRAYPTDLRTYDSLFGRWQSASRYFGPSSFWALSYPAAVWPVTANDRYMGPFTARGAPPILVVGTTFDPATPYQGAVDLARQLDSGVLLTMRGDGHTAYGGNSNCIDLRVERYLVALRTPARNTVCVQQSTPPAVSVEATPAVAAVRAAAVRLRLRGTGARLVRR